jgi:hypothetical protein
MSVLRFILAWGVLSVPTGFVIGRLLDRHPADIADLATIQHSLDHERKHSADLARRLAESEETNRHLTESVDHWRGVARDNIAALVNLRAKGRAS